MAEAALPSETTCKIRHVHIECPICLTRFIDPKILDCQHSFCLKCLQELVDKQDPKTDFIICPVCREKTSVPDKGPSALPNSFFLSSLIDDVINPDGSEEDINPPISSCEGCDEGLEAVSRCVDCDANFCKTCLQNHAKFKNHRHHKIVNAVGSSNERLRVKDKPGSLKCRKHTDQELCFYCDTCVSSVCPKCAVFHHRASEHDLSAIKDSIRSYRQAVEEALMKFDECRKEFKKVDDSITNSQHRLQIMVDRALNDIVAKEDKEVEKIRKASLLLQERVTQISKERGEEFERKRISNREKMSRAEQIVASVNDLMQQADDFELLDLKPKVMHNLTFHEELRFQTVQRGKSLVRFKGHDVVTDADIGEILKELEVEMEEFGTKGKAFGAAPSTGLFGQTAAATAPSGKTYAGASSLFSVGASSRSFADKAQGGTTVKFKPVISTDTDTKRGVTTYINTRHMFITAMKEYENKCVEELRLEDYAMAIEDLKQKEILTNTLSLAAITPKEEEHGGVWK
ncbi:E3 ubiquitin-protein ligase TRIM56-like [Asterias rubens]|uniref:E3 ubiquitin-protein ligase TRIM56-like n=1 Tax=Asterias rubens TaxID=7604 RepID=UPI0014557536|nr:E3 ubiquitin-protein ligase TRIM56-like [Asterias rubens]